MYYSTRCVSNGNRLAIYTLKKTLGELAKHYQKNLEVFGGNPNQEYMVFKGKPDKKTFLGFYVLKYGKLKKKAIFWEI